MNQADKQKKPVAVNNPPKRMSSGSNKDQKPLLVQEYFYNYFQSIDHAYNNKQSTNILSNLYRNIKSVEVKLVTWNKDSHGLFDYESKSVDLKFIKVETPCEIYRLKKDPPIDNQKEKEEFKILDSPVGLINKENLNNQNAIFLASVDLCEASQSLGNIQFQFNAFKDSLNTLKENQQQQESYLIVRSLKNEKNIQKGYELKIGDIVKFGRIEYQVVQLKNAKGDLQVRHIQKQIHFQEQFMDIEHQPKTCKICLSEDQTDENFFCNPCDCKGSCEYVHFECLKNWVQSKVKQKKADNTNVYSWKKSDCELCKKGLPKHVSYLGKLNDILDIEIPTDKPYIILESIAKEKKVVKTLFIFSTNEEDTEIKLGRGHQCEVRISDISVSRTHSMIKYKDGKFTIFDNNSKFGTLIKINENLDIASDKKAVQIGRTVITFAQKVGSTGNGNLFLDKTDSQKIGHHHHHQHNHNNQTNGVNGNLPTGLLGTQINPQQNGNGGNMNSSQSNHSNNVQSQNGGFLNQPNGYFNNLQQIGQYVPQQLNGNTQVNTQLYMQQQNNQGINVNQHGNQQYAQQNPQTQPPAQFLQYNQLFQNNNDQGSGQNKQSNKQGSNRQQ